MPVRFAFPPLQTGQLDLLLCLAEADLPVEMASIFGVSSLGTAAKVLRTYGVFVYLRSPKRGVLWVVDSAFDLWDRLGYSMKAS